MKHLKLLAATFACSFFLLAGCEKEIEPTVNPTSENLSKKKTPATNEKFTGFADLDQTIPELQPGLSLKTHPEYQEMILRAIGAVEATPCDDNTLINAWLDQQLANWYSEDGQLDPAIALALDLAVLDLPTYDALVFENSSQDQYFGVNGEYTKQLTKAFKDLQRFWNIQSDDIVLGAMHGNMLLDRDKIIRTYVAVYGLAPATAAAYADIVVELASEIPQFRDGNHPLFTFNAFALEGFDFPPYGIIPDKIIMGDGIMEAYTAIGYGDVAPQAILAHEFAHQIQFKLGLFEESPENVPEATRRTELMADAYAAYYLSHARGATMQWKRVQQFLQVFFNIGDCGFNSDGHHGTPTQRMAAAEWGYRLADNAQKQGHILTAEEFAQLFEAQLPELVVL